MFLNDENFLIVAKHHKGLVSRTNRIRRPIKVLPGSENAKRLTPRNRGQFLRGQTWTLETGLPSQKSSHQLGIVLL